MRMQFQIILAFLCLNMGFYIVAQTTDFPHLAITLTPEKISTDYDPTGDAWKPPKPTGITLIDFLWYVVWGIGKVLEMFLWAFGGFGIFLVGIGAPIVIVGPITAIVGFLYVWFILEFVTGRVVSD